MQYNNLDRNVVEQNNYVRKTIAFQVINSNTVQKLGVTDELSKYELLGIQARRAGDNVRTIDNKPVVNDAVFDSLFIDISNGQKQVVEKLPLSTIEAATKENPQWGLILNISDFRFNSSGYTIANKDAIVEGEVLELTFILKDKTEI